MILVVIVGLSISSRDGHSHTQRLLNWPPFLLLGKISLALYLVHEPIIQYVAWVGRPSQPWGFDMPMPVWGIAVVLPVSLILAALLHNKVEVPARTYLRARPRSH